ncbi:MAG TPA: zinc-binding dehydrogenase [Gemmatimonadaceae bacterium]|nr:zinc-binding dehydrogenase [Gemmatimonadaceae bacterium]
MTEVELPNSLDVGQVLVRVQYSGICGSQLGEIDGAKGEDRYLPHLLGHEGSGTVAEIGPGVRYVKPDDRVVLHWRRGQGIESVPPTYSWQGRTLNAGWVTTFNEWAVVSENRVTAIPADIDLRLAALFGCAVTTGFGVVVNNARLRIGESVVVLGAGGVGLNIVQAAALSGAYPIIAVDLHQNRLELAKEMGATHTVNAGRLDVERSLREIVGDRGVDCVIDNTGLPASIELGYRLSKSRGRVTLVGVPRAGANISIYSLPLHFGKVISGSHGGEAVPHEDIPRYMSLLQAGRIALSSLITNVYSLAEVNVALEDMRSGKSAGRSLIRMGPE